MPVKESPIGEWRKDLSKVSKTSLLLFPLFLISLLFPGCATRPGQWVKAADAEAKAEAEKFWYSQITRCGDSYFRESEVKGAGPEFFEIKDPIVRVAPRQMTEADRLNGVEWDGVTTLEAKATRMWGPTLRRWEAWSDGTGRMSDRTYPLKKVKGAWSVNTSRGGVFEEVISYVPVDCSKVPQQ